MHRLVDRIGSIDDSRLAFLVALCLVAAGCALAVVQSSGGGGSEAGDDDDILKAGETYELRWRWDWGWLVTIPDGVEGSVSCCSTDFWEVCEPVGDDGTVSESACRGEDTLTMVIRLWAKGWQAQAYMGARTGDEYGRRHFSLDDPSVPGPLREAHDKMDELFASLRKQPGPPLD